MDGKEPPPRTVDSGVREVFEWLGGGGAVTVESLKEVCEQFKIGGDWVEGVGGSLDLDEFDNLLGGRSQRLGETGGTGEPTDPLLHPTAQGTNSSAHDSPLLTPLMHTFSPRQAVVTRETLLFNSSWPVPNPHGMYVDDFNETQGLTDELEDSAGVEECDVSAEEPELIVKTDEDEIENEEVTTDDEEETVEVPLGEVAERVLLVRRGLGKGVLSDVDEGEGRRWRVDDDDSTEPSEVTGSGGMADIDDTTCPSTASVTSLYSHTPPLYPPDHFETSTTSSDSFLDDLDLLLAHPINHLVHTIPPPNTCYVPRSEPSPVRSEKPPLVIKASEGILNVRRAKAVKTRLVDKIRSAIQNCRPGNAWFAGVLPETALPQHVKDFLTETPHNNKPFVKKNRSVPPKVAPLVWRRKRRPPRHAPKITNPPWNSSTLPTAINPTPKRTPTPKEFSSPPPVPRPLEPAKTPTVQPSYEAAPRAAAAPCEEWDATPEGTKDNLRKALEESLGVRRRNKY